MSLKYVILLLVFELFLVIQGEIKCPDQRSECPDETTCCLLKGGEYGCCPLPNAVCCEDNLHCCPEGTTCDTEHERCVNVRFH